MKKINLKIILQQGRLNPVGILSCLIILLGLAIASSCKKTFLDKKPNQSLLVPTTLSDFQAILDNNTVMNSAPYLDMVSTDDIYTIDDGYAGADYLTQNSYLWAKDIYEGQTDYDWNIPYQQVFYANVVLDGLQKVKRDSSNAAQYDRIRGTALFFRAFAFYNLAIEFAAPYNPNTAATVPGIPLRLSSDVNLKSARGNLSQTFQQIVTDLTQASGLLPVQTQFILQPTRAGAFGMLARTFLIMQDYDKAKAAASAVIGMNYQLMNYNNFSTTATRPFPKVLPVNGNTEILFYCPLISNASFLLSPTLTMIDSGLYKSYDANDLRKYEFFKPSSGGGYLFRGNYSNGANVFAGVGLDEVYLTRAEASARTGDLSGALQDLNFLLINRWRTGTYVPYASADANTVLAAILVERRKELVYRNLRWADLKRLNQDTRFAKEINRDINDTKYTLAPGDNRYAFPIPPDEVASSGIQQNPR